MTTPTVTELPIRLEPVAPDPFLIGLELADPPTTDPDDAERQQQLPAWAA